MRSPAIFATLILTFTATSFAQNAAPAPAAKPEIVIVPYDPAKPVAQQKPDQFYLPYEHFLELWEAAKQQRTGKKPEPAPAAFVLSTARYEGVLGERAVAFTGKLDVTTYNEAWAPVPLPLLVALALKFTALPTTAGAGVAGVASTTLPPLPPVLAVTVQVMLALALLIPSLAARLTA